MQRLALVFLALAFATPALADGREACEAFAVKFLTAHGASLKSVKIDSDSLIINRFDDNVGSQRVSTEYVGWADAGWADSTTRERFVCLDAGDATPVYFSFIPLN
ncbi:MAG: hypothetical protein ABI399_07505 [Bauldia sp.]